MKSFKQREEDVFQECLELPPGERESFVESSCANDTKLRDGVLGLLRSHETAGGFLESLPAEDSARVAARLKHIAPAEESPGDQIGRYKLLELIGEGSSGFVWMAEQTEDIERLVALKILKLGLDTREFLARFEAERQMLAMMDHPNIAHVLDAAATDHGRPYFVMELVKGMPLLEYVDRECMSIEPRVKLFIKICHAAQHAHQKGIIHRDLKPSNILVKVLDDEPVPKIIDFGVAKTTQFHLTDRTLFTGLHTFIGTPVYSSPEQLECSGLDVDNRSDIYSLGAMLYELLCGRTPFDADRLAKLGLEGMRTMIRERDPMRPSVRFKNLPAEDQAEIAGKRTSPPSRIEPRLRGDLDWIVMKCLEKDRKRRYETANALARDLEAFLEHRPVSATPPSLTYRIGKFITRHRLGYAAWATVPALLFGILALFFYFHSGTSPLQNQESVLIWTNRYFDPEKSVAVLPFANLSPDVENMFLDGGAEDTIQRGLLNIEDLLVLGRTSTNQYRDSAKPYKQIGEELKVRYLVDGSVQWANNRVQVLVFLIDTQTEAQIWTRTYHLEQNIFAIQSDVTREVAAQLQILLSPQEIAGIEHRATENQEAFACLLKAKEAGSEAETIHLLEQAVALDRNFAEAWRQLAQARIWSWRHIYYRKDPELRASAHRALEETRRLDPGSPGTLVIKAIFAYNEQDDLAASIRLLLEALALDPGKAAAAQTLLGWRYFELGRLVEAKYYLEAGFRFDSSAGFTHSYRLLEIYEQLNQWNKARALIQMILGGIESDDPRSIEARRHYYLTQRVALMDYRISGDREAFISDYETSLAQSLVIPDTTFETSIPEFLVSPITQYRTSFPEFTLPHYHQAWKSLLERDLQNGLQHLEAMGEELGRIESRGQFSFGFHLANGLRITPIDLLLALTKFELDIDKDYVMNAEKAEGFLRDSIEGDPLVDIYTLSQLAICHALKGDRENTESTIRKVRELTALERWKYTRQAISEVQIAIAYMALGDQDEAIETLEAASRMDSPIFLNRELDLWFIFDRLRGNPRFDRLLE